MQNLKNGLEKLKIDQVGIDLAISELNWWCVSGIKDLSLETISTDDFLIGLEKKYLSIEVLNDWIVEAAIAQFKSNIISIDHLDKYFAKCDLSECGTYVTFCKGNVIFFYKIGFQKGWRFCLLAD